MRYRLNLTLRKADGVLTRLFGAIERRGFRPLSAKGKLHPDQDRWRVRLIVEGERSGTSLRLHLAGLYDCLAVDVLPCN